jgi:hypothetical protein
MQAAPTPSPALPEATPTDGVLPTIYLTSYQDVSAAFRSPLPVDADDLSVLDSSIRSDGPQCSHHDASRRYVSPPLKSSACQRMLNLVLLPLYRWLNATQILKVAGMPKTQRTKYLEREIITGRHEKVQGGCKYFRNGAHRSQIADLNDLHPRWKVPGDLVITRAHCTRAYELIRFPNPGYRMK